MAATRQKRTGRKSAPALEPKPVDPEVLRKMRFLTRFYSRGQLQVHLQDLLAGLPLTMAYNERLLRLRALKQLGYKDYNKRKTANNDDTTD